MHKPMRASRPRVAAPIVAGALLAALLVVMLFFLIRGDTAREAIRRAEQQIGGGYRFAVTNLQIRSTTSEKNVFAIVAAYNDSGLKTVHVNWKE